MMQARFAILTGGNGLWSQAKRLVPVTRLELGYVSDEGDFGELRVYFDVRNWNVEKLGLIYTDRAFMTSLQRRLDKMGLVGADVSYSEQGMQGEDYVSCDVGADFIASWQAVSQAQQDLENVLS
jgi:hypothetical protein